jgi:hypothetical protein
LNERLNNAVGADLRDFRSRPNADAPMPPDLHVNDVRAATDRAVFDQLLPKSGGMIQQDLDLLSAGVADPDRFVS